MIKIAIVVSDFNKEITSKMEKKAENLAASLGAEIVKKVHVPGAFEIPFAVKQLFEKEEIDAITNQVIAEETIVKPTKEK